MFSFVDLIILFLSLMTLNMCWCWSRLWLWPQLRLWRYIIKINTQFKLYLSLIGTVQCLGYGGYYGPSYGYGGTYTVFI